ncbi:MAG: YibE/F family protein [Anaerolineales bacterium]|nr:YibE/F family protein [Anaerolineales bacterium]
MKVKLRSYLILAVPAILLGILIGYITANRPTQTSEEDQRFSTSKAVVRTIVEEELIQLGEQQQTFQRLEVEVTDGDFAGKRFVVDYGRTALHPEGQIFKPGDPLLITIETYPDGTLYAYFSDIIRTEPLLWLTVGFIILILLVGREKGLRSLISLAASFAVIFLYILPAILNGSNPVWVSIIGSIAFLSVTQYLIYGWTLKAHTALIGMFLAVVLSTLLASLMLQLTHLTGFGTENALLLAQLGGQTINLKGLLLSGMIIGTLGVLDDLVIGQVSVVFTLVNSNPDLSLQSLINRAMIVGQDHIAATVNTLVLAYVGASLPLLLIFTTFNLPFMLAINREFIIEEIVRTLVGSSGLVLSVPIATFLAAYIAQHAESIQKKAPWLGSQLLASEQDQK